MSHETGAARARGDRSEVRDVDVEHRTYTKPAKTSAAAAFALALGTAALVGVLSVVLSPIGLVLGIVGIILGFVGIRAAKKVGVTGRGVAIAGLVLSAVVVLLGALAAVGVTTLLNNESAVQRLETQVEKLRDNLPKDVDLPSK